MTKESTVQEIGKPILMPLGIMQVIFLLGLLSSPFIWIWHTWDLAWRVGLTSIIGASIIGLLYSSAKKVIIQSIEDASDKIQRRGAKTNFQVRLEKLQKERDGRN